MADSFQETQDSGLLKDYYGKSELETALKKKRDKLAESKLGLVKNADKDDNSGSDSY